ncbi:MAG: hypothetical protein KGL63_04980 [Betaproteobacteria bacterium]|nr:hypothetical protein [Betaproteobacteria bacterium]
MIRDIDAAGEIIRPKKKIKIKIDLPPPPPELEDEQCNVCGSMERSWLIYQMIEGRVCVQCCARPSFNPDGPDYPDNTVFAAARGVINAIKKEAAGARK